MKITQIVFLILILTPARVFCQGKEQGFILTDSSSISLITASPGEELYTRFGHSAIRVHDPDLSLDLVFNYGTFDFNTPGFYVKFLRGKLLYFLNYYDFRYMLPEYMRLNQSLYEQILNLTLPERQKIFDFLIDNYRPENRYYLYDFFFDNCSTRIRDVFKNILGDTLIFHDYTAGTATFRQLVDSCLEKAPWGKFGVDLVLGLPSDMVATPWERMFIPHEMMRAFNHADIKNDSAVRLFAKPVKTLYTEIPVAENQELFTPGFVFWVLFFLILAVTIVQIVAHIDIPWIDVILFSVSGILGLAILFMWFGTDHQATRNNLNILWALPFNILVPFIILKNRESVLLKWYLICNTILLIIILLGWNMLPQQYNIADIPIILIYLIRGVYLLILSHNLPFSSKFNRSNHVE